MKTVPSATCACTQGYIDSLHWMSVHWRSLFYEISCRWSKVRLVLVLYNISINHWFWNILQYYQTLQFLDVWDPESGGSNQTLLLRSSVYHIIINDINNYQWCVFFFAIIWILISFYIEIYFFFLKRIFHAHHQIWIHVYTYIVINDKKIRI